MIAYETGVGQVTGTFPATAAKNSTTVGGTDGTPLVAAVYNNIWGFFQALMSQAGLTPNGVEEAYNASQLLSASQHLFGADPGDLYLSLVQSPVSVGARALILTGQVISIATYSQLVANTYIGNGNNGNTAYQYFYKCSDAGGTTRDTAGTYFKLPDFRGVFLRGLDIGATRNPNGASDYLGNYRADSLQYHYHQYTMTRNSGTAGATSNFSRGSTNDDPVTLGQADPSNSTGHDAVRADEETRAKQGIIQIGIRY